MTDLYFCVASVMSRVFEDPECPQGLKLLASYWAKSCVKFTQDPHVGSWILDCGAYSALSAGKVLAVEPYIDYCREVLTWARPPAEIFALDVIGDWRGTERNYEAMLKAGIVCTPTWHRGSPPAQLVALASSSSKIAIGGVAKWRHGGGRERTAWLAQQVGRVWPKRIHAFGVTTEDTILSVPFASADSTSWYKLPWRGHWYGGEIKPLFKTSSLVPMISRYLDLERRAKIRWARVMEKL